jgi:site-specific recombinase XerD
MRTRALLPSEVSLLERALAERGQHRDRLLLLLLVSTGFRISELLSLRFEQLLTPRGAVASELTIERQLLKGGRGARRWSVRSRRVVLNECARSAIEEFLCRLEFLPPPGGPVFLSPKGDGRPIRRGQAHHLLKKIAREVGIDATRVGCHSLRKAYARGIYEASGKDLLRTQRLIGHASPLTTMAYIDSDQQELDELALGFNPLAPLGNSPFSAAPNSMQFTSG